MKKIIPSFLLCCVLFVTFPFCVYASNRVNTIDIEATVFEDGAMGITQVWEGTFEEGTENYIPMNLPDYITLSELKVSDQNGVYQTVEDWDINWNFKEKANKCGIHQTDDGFELCFGISQYGKKRYTISYRLSNAVSAYSDKDGVNFRFVNAQMNTTPTNVSVKIQLANGTPITDEFADIWAFGFHGEVQFEDGTIHAYTTDPIESENHVTVMFSFNKGVLSPTHQESGSFEEVKQRAFEDSDYSEYNDEDVSVWVVLLIIFMVFILPIAIIIIVHIVKQKTEEKKRRQFSQRFGYFRDIPNEGNISATYTLGRMFQVCKDGSILATGILRLIEIGCLIPVNTEDVGFMGKTKETVNLRLTGGIHHKMNAFDEFLYTILETAAGPDQILQAKELGHFANRNDRLLRIYIENHDNAGRTYLSQKQCFKRWRNPAKFVDLTPSGEKKLGELLGFKRYLEDFSLIAERGVNEIAIWRELLTYAMLFGIADKVAKQMKELYPELSAEITTYSQTISTAYAYNALLYSNMIRAEQERIQEQRSRGSGGFSSFGGGGGSIGGGFGGGSR